MRELIEKNNYLTDNEVVAKITNGEKEFFSILIKRNNQRLFRVIRSYFNDEDEARDVMQETYLKAFEKISQFRGEAAFSTWLIRIGINESYLRLRKLNRINDYIDDDTQEDVIENSPQEINYKTPENMMIRKELSAQIEKAIDDLPHKYRIIYVMRELEGLSVAETASHLNLTESNVKVRLHRAKDLLKLELSDHVLPNIYEFGNHKCDKMIEDTIHKILLVE